MKLAKALQFCFERFTKLDKLAHMPASTFNSSHPDFSDEPERHHYQGSLSEPAPVKPTADVEQDTLVAEMMDIQGAGFATSPLAKASSLSWHPVSATFSPAPIMRISVEEPVKPLGPTPNVLIVEDNPINVCITKLIVCFVNRLLTIVHRAAHASGDIHSEKEVPVYQSCEWTSWCGSSQGKAWEF